MGMVDVRSQPLNRKFAVPRRKEVNNLTKAKNKESGRESATPPRPLAAEASA